MDNLISIITCTLNSAKYLDELLTSVLQQTVRPSQHVFVDGGSNDGTLEAISTYAKIVDFDVVTLYAPPMGIANAMNKGAKAATGEFLIHLHSDDLFYDINSLAIVQSSLVDRRSNWIAAGCEYVNAQGIQRGIGPSGPYSRAALLKSNILSHPSTVLRRSTFERMGGFDETLGYAMDYDLWLRMSSNERPLILHEITTKFRVHEGSTTSSNVKAMRREDLTVRLRFTKGISARTLACSRFMLIELLLSHSKMHETYLRAKRLLNRSEN